MSVEGDTNLEPVDPVEPTGQQPEATESTEEAVSSSSLLDALRGSLGQSEEEGDAPSEGEGEASVDTRLRGPDGRFLPKDAADPNAQQQAPEAKAPEQAKPEDDPYREPEGLKPEAKERFQALVSRAKEATAAAEQATAQVAQMQQGVEVYRQLVAESGASDQEIAALFGFARAVKSGNWQAAEPMLAHLTQQYRVAMGRDPNGADPFAQHADLAQAVQDGKITPEAAREVLQAREVLRRQQMAQQQAQTQQATEQQQRQAIERGAAEVNALVQQWSQTDLDWPKKQALMLEHAKRIGDTMDPQYWQAAMRLAYDAIGQTMTTMAPQRTPAGPGTPQPLRPAAANAGRREPASLQEAIAGAIGAA